MTPAATRWDSGWEADWDEERSATRKRELGSLFARSIGAHVLLLLLVTFAPSPKPPPLPAVVSVDLLTAPQMKRPSLSVPKPAPPAPRQPQQPQQAPKPPPPPPKPKVAVLPKQARQPANRPQKVVRPSKPRPKELEYEDAIAKLRDELGIEPQVAPTPIEDELSDDAEVEPPGAGAPVPPEVAAWLIATERRVRSVWVTPPEFLERSLQTELRVSLTADGGVLGTPVVVRSSGDPFWDDNAVRAVLRASPLPPPPEPGDWPFVFTPEEGG